MEADVIDQPQITTHPRMTRKDERFKQALQNPLLTIRKLNDESLYNFTRCFWPEVTQDEFIPNWHIQIFCDEAKKLANRVGNRLKKLYDLIINVPPGTTKTKVWSVMFPVWCWTKWYWMQFITGSYSQALALEAAECSRDIMRSEKFKLIYPELDIKQDKDTKSNFKVVKRFWEYPGQAPRQIAGGNRFSTSVGGTATGMHGHINILDDPLNPEQAASDTELRTANRWVDQTMSTRKTDKKISVMVLIMQRLHEDDPSGHLLKKPGKRFRHICLPGQIVDYYDQLNPEEFAQYYEDGLLDINRMSWDVLEEMEADLGQYGFSGQVGQNPVPPSGGMFKVDHIQIIQSMPAPVNIVKTIRFWDKAGTSEKELKAGSSSPRTAGVKICKLQNGKFIVVDVKKGRWSSDERERIIRETAEVDGTTVEIGVEQEPGSGGKESAQGTIINLAGFNVYRECPTGDKVARADRFSVQVNEGNVMLLQGDWNQDFIKEYRFFPFGTFKDQVDAGSSAFNRLTGKKEVRIVR